MRSSDRRKLRIFALAIFAVLVVVVAGCGSGSSSSSTSGGSGGGGESAGTPKQGGTINVTNAEENITLNPLLAYVPADVNVISAINESLFKENSEGKTVPWLVEQFETAENEKVWTLHLKKNVKFSDGKPMTSADVVFSLESVKKSEVYGALLENVTAIEAPNGSTVVIKNKVPAPETPLNLSQWSFGIMPKNFGGESEAEFGEHPIGTGPFEFVSWKKGESMTLAKNPHYWIPDRPYLSKIVFHTVEDPNSRASQLRGGELDLIYQPPWEQLESIENAPETEVVDTPLGISFQIMLNVRKPLFQNKKIREAFNIALDREGIVQAALSGHGEPVGAYVSPPIYGYNPNIEAPEQNIEKAKELVAEAVKEGAEPKTTLMFAKENPFWVTASQVVQQNLEEVGFTVNIEKTDSNTSVTKAIAGEYDAFAVYNYEPSGEAAELFSFYNAYEGNWTGADTTQMEKLLPKAVQEVNDKKREEDYWHMQDIVAEEQNVIVVAAAPYAWAQSSNLTGFYVSRGGVAWFGEAGFME